MKSISKNSDSIFLVLVIIAFVTGAVVMALQWRVVHSYWQTDFTIHSDDVNPDQIVSLPSGRDKLIVPIDAPLFAPVPIVTRHFNPSDPMIVVDTFGVSRAYPLQILAAHEIVNDEMGGVPIAVTFCPLCNSAVVYHREMDGEVLRLGVSGNFYGNNFLMYDDLTESWWYQFTGEGIVGEYTGRWLEVVPSQVASFEAFATRYPTGDVLVGDANSPNRMYHLSTLITYQSSREPALSHGEYDTRLASMERVLATTVNDVPIAFSFHDLQESGVVNHTLAGEDIVVFWMPSASNSQVTQANQMDVGQAAAFGRVFNGQTLTFRAENGRIFDNQTDSEWNIFGEAIAGELIGTSLPDLQCFTHFWFAWSSAHPDTLVYNG